VQRSLIAGKFLRLVVFVSGLGGYSNGGPSTKWTLDPQSLNRCFSDLADAELCTQDSPRIGMLSFKEIKQLNRKRSIDMLTLLKAENKGLQVKPRWPSSEVLIENNVFDKLMEAQSRLPPTIQLLLVRGYESKSSHLGAFRDLSRWLGIKLFCACYPGRKDEINEIFGSNGHDVDGTHVDISIILNGKRLRFLPLGVFTSPSLQHKRAAEHLSVVENVKSVLEQCGFVIHKNPTESMQIHCDFKG
jgi:hypothetical protein